jgi:hypothetical protein
MNKEFIPYEQALELEELGFYQYCFSFKTSWDFDDNLEIDVPLPLYQQAFRWFREKYEVKVISIGGDKNKKFSYLLHLKDNSQVVGEKYNTYEEAELACLIKLIEIVKK